jgi:hypothetical protein
MKKYNIFSFKSFVVLTAIILGSISLKMSSKNADLERRVKELEVAAQFVDRSDSTNESGGLSLEDTVPEKNVKPQSDAGNQVWGAPNKYLSKRIGMDYEPRTFYRINNEELLAKLHRAHKLTSGDFYYIKNNKKYRFTITGNEDHVMETLIIRYEDEKGENKATVRLEDAFHIGKISTLYLYDLINGTSIVIRRDKQGNIEYNDQKITEGGAKGLLEYYDLELEYFRGSASIDYYISRAGRNPIRIFDETLYTPADPNAFHHGRRLEIEIGSDKSTKISQSSGSYKKE